MLLAEGIILYPKFKYFTRRKKKIFFLVSTIYFTTDICFIQNELCLKNILSRAGLNLSRSTMAEELGSSIFRTCINDDNDL